MFDDRVLIRIPKIPAERMRDSNAYRRRRRRLEALEDVVFVVGSKICNDVEEVNVDNVRIREVSGWSMWRMW